MAWHLMEVFQPSDLDHFLRSLLASALERQRCERDDQAAASMAVLAAEEAETARRLEEEAPRPRLTPAEFLKQSAGLRRNALRRQLALEAGEAVEEGEEDVQVAAAVAAAAPVGAAAADALAVAAALKKLEKPPPEPETRQFLVDKARLDEASGLLFSRQKRALTKDDPMDDFAEWGSEVAGVVEGDWLKIDCEQYIPTRLNGVLVVQPVPDSEGKYMVDYSRLKTNVGLRFTSVKGTEDTEMGTAPWGSVVSGYDEGDGWVKIGYRYLPRRLNGRLVLTFFRPGQAAKPKAKAAVAKAPARAEAKAAAEAADAQAEDDLFDLCKEIQDSRSMVRNGAMDSDNMRWFAVKMLGIAKKSAHWENGWVGLCLPEEKRQEAGLELVKVLLDFMVRDLESRVKPVANALAWLSKGQRVKLSLVEAAFRKYLRGSLTRCPSVWKLISWLLFHWFPRPKDHGWGWSRVGWSWREWWRLTEKVLESLPAGAAFQALRGALEHMEEAEARSTCRQELWTQARLDLLKEKFLHLGKQAPALGISSAGSEDALKAALKGINILGPAGGDSSAAGSSEGSSDSDSC